MNTIIGAQEGFFVLIGLFLIGALGSLALYRNAVLANIWSFFFAMIGSLWGIAFSLLCLQAPYALEIEALLSHSPLLSLSFTIDKLSGFFLFTISLIALFCSLYGMGYARQFFGRYNLGTLGFFYNIFICGMMLVVSSSNSVLFLFAWELMSLASYFLVIYEHKEESNVRAGFRYFIMMHIGTAFVVFAFLLLFKFTGSFSFASIGEQIALVPALAQSIIFFCALIGFGMKAGIIPLHTWLPAAHPAAPSLVSALMSGVMIKTGIYMMIRVFLDMFSAIPEWWGLVVLAVGAISSLLGVLYALNEHDLKRLLAYHSIENIGIILLGLGSAMTFLSFDMPELAVIGIIAALFHTLNHATFKSLLFLSAGSVISQTHTRNIEELGGIAKRMPATAFLFLIGAMAISALPPLNGFFSEWLTFQTLFQGVSSLDVISKWLFLLSAGSLALTSGLAIACFVKAFGVTFLARPRSHEAEHAAESSFSLIFSMGLLAGMIMLLGIFAGTIASFLREIANALINSSSVPQVFNSSFEGIHIGGFAEVSSLGIAGVLAGSILVIAMMVKYGVKRNQKVSIGSTWDCGVDLTSRMEITGTGFSRSLILIFKGILKPTKQTGIEYSDADSRYLPKARTIAFGLADVYKEYIENPVYNLLVSISEWTKRFQGGNLNAYIMYIFVALLIVLIASLL